MKEWRIVFIYMLTIGDNFTGEYVWHLKSASYLFNVA